jgi:hypothetical protein
MKKRYTITYASSFDAVVTIDHDVCTDAHLHEINNFWSNADYRLRRAGGDITKAMLKLLGLQLFHSTITDLAPEDTWRSQPPEGWPPLGGSHGIQLLSLDYFELDEGEITIKSEDV